jgi:general stress protein 26
MSIAVALDELADVLADRPWGYLVTVRDEGRAQTLAIPTVFDGGSLTATVGKGTAANLVARPNVTLVFPGTDGEAMSLIVDGDATVTGDRVEVRPTWAVLHRPALGRD